MTPAKLAETLRVQAAREAIERSDTPSGTIAIRYGFGDEQRMRRAFARQFRVTPNDIRSRFCGSPGREAHLGDVLEPDPSFRAGTPDAASVTPAPDSKRSRT